MLKIFLAEDEVVVRETIKRMIPWEELGFELVGEAADGEMALPLLIRQQPDLLITDIKMPFMDGLTLARLARERCRLMRRTAAAIFLRHWSAVPWT